MGNIPDTSPEFRKMMRDIIDKYKPAPKGHELTCQACLKKITVDNATHPFVIRKGYRKWYFCSYDCQAKFRKAGIYGPTKR